MTRHGSTDSGAGDTSSGTLADSHQSFSTLPVLVPPENVKPWDARTLKFTSTPSKTRVSSPTSFVDLIDVADLAEHVRVHVVQPGDVAPLFGRRGSFGTARVKDADIVRPDPLVVSHRPAAGKHREGAAVVADLHRRPREELLLHRHAERPV